MTTQGNASDGTHGNGRKTALIVIAIAFIASATTAMLAFNASHRAREADARALPADAAELRGIVADWRSELEQAKQASHEDLKPYIDRLTARTTSLSAWKARTPCGQDARDRLHEAMDTRLRWLTRIQAGKAEGNVPADETRILETALGECAAGAGRDVNI